MKHQVRELEGSLLDAAVAKAEGLRFRVLEEAESPLGRRLTVAWPPHHQMTLSSAEEFEPSSDWGAGGPIIEREGISVSPWYEPDRWVANVRPRQAFGVTEGDDGYGEGQTPLIAAMRAYVASKFGEEVELP
jgi:hypothetical protein